VARACARVSEEAATSAQLTRAQLQLQAGEPAAAVETLKALEQQNAEQPAVVAMLARAYRALDDRAQLLALLPRLARASLPTVERVHLEQLAVEGELSRPDLTAERLAEVWNALPGEVRDAAAVIAERARALARLGDSEQAERELRGALKREWQQALVEAYGEVRGPDPAKQLKHVESWLDTHPTTRRCSIRPRAFRSPTSSGARRAAIWNRAWRSRRSPRRTGCTAGC
jgi:HemY protein